MTDIVQIRGNEMKKFNFEKTAFQYRFDGQYPVKGNKTACKRLIADISKLMIFDSIIEDLQIFLEDLQADDFHIYDDDGFAFGIMANLSGIYIWYNCCK